MMKRILVVEDQEDDRQIIRDLLAGKDYEIIEAEDGEHALAAVAKERPDLILMEIQLPSMDGHETMRRIRTDPALLSTPIIAVSSYAPSEEVHDAPLCEVRRRNRVQLVEEGGRRVGSITRPQDSRTAAGNGVPAGTIALVRSFDA
jgi:two-component system cell cycle response regulator DivK